MTSLIISVCGIHSHPTTEANPLRQPLPSAILAWNELDTLESVEPNWFSAAYLLSYAFPCSISSLFSSLSLCPAPWLALFGHVKLTSSPTPCTDELQVRLVHRRRARASLRFASLSAEREERRGFCCTSLYRCFPCGWPSPRERALKYRW